MTKDQAQQVKIGDYVRPIKFWNETESKDKLEPMVIVHGIMKAQSQTGLLFLVLCVNGNERWLDAGWFDECV